MAGKKLGTWGRLATLGGMGNIPVAPGTAATLLAGIPAAYGLKSLPTPLGLLFLLILFALSCRACARAEEELGEKDPSRVVLDEIVGYLVTVLFLPKGFGPLLWGFAAFRLFDIWKPWPIRFLEERVSGGPGIVLDDVLAGLYAFALTTVLCFAFSHP